MAGLPQGILGLLLAAFTLICDPFGAQADGRERIHIVGSESVFPLAVAAAEAFSVKTRFLTPVVETNGSETGFKLFCAGKGVEHPDIATAERRITRNELAKCRQRGISVAEIKFGHRGVVLAKSRRGQPLSLTQKQVFLAFGRQVLVDGKVIANPYRLWSDIDFSLPVTSIETFGPPLHRAERNTFTDLVMAPNAVGLLRASGKRDKDAVASASRLRDDGVFSETADDAAMLNRLTVKPDALGIVGFTFLQQNAATLQAVPVDGVAPSAASIADGSYAPANPFYLYIKRENVRVIPGVQEYVAEITSDAASGSDGYLVKRGLIPLPPGERAALAEAASRLIALRK